jgi:hypothetical protein
MSLRRTFRSRCESFALIASHAVGRDEQRITVSSSTATEMLAPRLSDTFDRMELRLIAAGLGPTVMPGDDRDTLERLVLAIAAGRLVFVRADPPRTWGYDAPSKRANSKFETQERAQPVEDASHWVELHLVDDDGVGLASQRYLVVTPEGRQYRGYTDSLGSARVTHLPPGPYQVSFPDLDGSACERA